MTRPRVLFVCHTGVVSGAEIVLVDIACDWRDAAAFVFEAGDLSDRLAALGLTVTISKHGAGLARFRRDRSLLSALTKVGQFGALIRDLISAARGCDVVYANSQKAFTIAAMASLFAPRPLIWHLHDILDATHFGAVQRRMQVWLANRCASAVIVPSTAAATAFRRAGGKASLVRVVPNGRDVTPDPRDKASLRQALGLPPGPLIGVFSRLAPWKGQHIVIQALAMSPTITCVIVGGALFGEDDYVNELHELVRESGLSDRVLFLGHRSDAPLMMQAVDVMLHASIAPEPFGLTLIEAMRVGTPVIATDTGASREILAGGRCGTLVPPGDVEALAWAIGGVLATPEQHRARAEAAAERARTVYTVAAMQSAIAEVITAQGADHEATEARICSR